MPSSVPSRSDDGIYTITDCFAGMPHRTDNRHHVDAQGVRVRYS